MLLCLGAREEGRGYLNIYLQKYSKLKQLTFHILTAIECNGFGTGTPKLSIALSFALENIALHGRQNASTHFSRIRTRRYRKSASLLSFSKFSGNNELPMYVVVTVPNKAYRMIVANSCG